MNNKINLSNMFYINGEIVVSDWEYSAVRRENKIQGNHFQLRLQPILKYENDWLVTP